ncbi:MAG: hypothetical protein H7Y60_16910 [Rhodospirillaceae bacterium]|nr:hypothetical protein [Rhodospirillales bacterium]
MKKTIALAAAMVATQIGPAHAAYEVMNTPGVTSDKAIFAVIDRVEGNTLSLHFVHTVTSATGEGAILFSGDKAEATLEPSEAGANRRAACVTAIRGKQGPGRVVSTTQTPFPHVGCLGAVHDFEGRAGLPVDGIRAGMATRIMLNGDLHFVLSK